MLAPHRPCRPTRPRSVTMTFTAATLTADALRAAAEQAGEDVDRCLALAAEVGTALPPPAAGQTWRRWSLLAAAAEGGLTAARVLEAHSDALAILAEAGEPAPRERGVSSRPRRRARAWTRRWATAVPRAWSERSRGARWGVCWTTPSSPPGSAPSVGCSPWICDIPLSIPEPAERWVARGLRAVTSAPVRFEDTAARAIGEAGWYLHRAGFAWGGMGVAACWFGAAVALRATLVAGRREAR